MHDFLNKLCQHTRTHAYIILYVYDQLFFSVRKGYMWMRLPLQSPWQFSCDGHTQPGSFIASQAGAISPGPPV